VTGDIVWMEGRKHGVATKSFMKLGYQCVKCNDVLQGLDKLLRSCKLNLCISKYRLYTIL
jgi:urease gamma subunit